VPSNLVRLVWGRGCVKNTRQGCWESPEGRVVSTCTERVGVLAVTFSKAPSMKMPINAGLVLSPPHRQDESNYVLNPRSPKTGGSAMFVVWTISTKFAACILCHENYERGQSFGRVKPNAYVHVLGCCAGADRMVGDRSDTGCEGACWFCSRENTKCPHPPLYETIQRIMSRWAQTSPRYPLGVLAIKST